MIGRQQRAVDVEIAGVEHVSAQPVFLRAMSARHAGRRFPRSEEAGEFGVLLIRHMVLAGQHDDGVFGHRPLDELDRLGRGFPGRVHAGDFRGEDRM